MGVLGRCLGVLFGAASQEDALAHAHPPHLVHKAVYLPKKQWGAKGHSGDAWGGSRHPPPQQNGGDGSSAAAEGAEDGEMLGKD